METLPKAGASPASRAVITALAAAPWLIPFAGGPSPVAVQFAAAGACLAGLVAVAGLARPRWVALAPLLFVILALLTANGDVSGRVIAVLAVGGAAVAVALGAALARDDDLASACLSGWALGAVVNASIGIAQYLAGDAAAWALVGGAMDGRGVGMLRQANQLGTLCAIGVLTAAALLRDPRRSAWWALAGCACAAGAAVTASRTALLQVVLVVAVVLVWAAGRRLTMFALAVLVTYAGSVLLLPLLAEVLSGTPGTTVLARASAGMACESRAVLWQNVIELTAEHPWRGWGWGELDHAHLVHRYAGERFCAILDNAHSLPLHLAVELGWPVAALVVGSLAAWAVACWPRSKRPALANDWWVVAMLIGLHSLLEYPLWYAPFLLALGVCLGGAAGSAQPGAGVRRHAGWIAAAALLAISSGVAWDYFRVSQVYLSPDRRAPMFVQDTLEKSLQTWLFQPQARFAQLTLETVTPANAASLRDAALQVLHYSPEPKVIEKLLEAQQALGLHEERATWAERYRAAFPDDYAHWQARSTGR